MPTLNRRLFIAGSAAALALPHVARATVPAELRIDWATYNPVSLVLKDRGLLEQEFAAEGTTITWVKSTGGNKALEFMNAGALDFGSTAGSTALIGKINGNPIKSIYVFSKPEWTALVTRPDTGITKVEDLKGKSVAVTRGTDPHCFLVRALTGVGLSEADITEVLLQHPDGKTALIRGDVDAWAGLDPMMAAAELEDGALIFFRNPAANTWGILNTREDFLQQSPDVVERVLKVYEQARTYALENPADLKAIVGEVTGLPAAVINRQIDERTDLTHSRIGAAQRESILAAGIALQSAGVIGKDQDVAATLDGMIDDRLPTA